MKKSALLPAALALTVAVVSCEKSRDLTLTVENPSAFVRHELASVSLADITARTGDTFSITDAEGAEVPYQITHDSLVVFAVELAPGDSAMYTITTAAPTAVADTIACGGFYPERYDDFAWENDRAAYRAYGPALQARGEHSYGYDVWTKSVAHPVVARRYRQHLSSPVSYHEDYGDGMDVYSVGPTLGGGTAALVDPTGALVYPRSFASYDILDNGPLRFAVRLTYNPVEFAGDSVVEERVITLDAFADLNRTEVSYRGLSRPARIAAGIVVHKATANNYNLNQSTKSATYADPTDNPEAGHGTIWLGMVAPQADSLALRRLPEPAGEAVAHILAEGTVAPGESFSYAWGSGWSKGFVPDSITWARLVDQAAASIDQPLKISLK